MFAPRERRKSYPLALWAVEIWSPVYAEWMVSIPTWIVANVVGTLAIGARQQSRSCGDDVVICSEGLVVNVEDGWEVIGTAVEQK